MSTVAERRGAPIPYLWWERFWRSTILDVDAAHSFPKFWRLAAPTGCECFRKPVPFAGRDRPFASRCDDLAGRRSHSASELTKDSPLPREKYGSLKVRNGAHPALGRHVRRLAKTQRIGTNRGDFPAPASSFPTVSFPVRILVVSLGSMGYVGNLKNHVLKVRKP